jgi:hypothetical protein
MRATILFALVTLPGACGYSAGQIGGGEGQSLAVTAFTNQTLRRDLERDLTRVVLDEFRTRTSYRLTGAGDADFVMHGRITEIRELVLSERSLGRIRESSVQITAVVTVSNRRTGEKVVDRARLVEQSSFAPVKGESLRTAELAAMRALAEKIVYRISAIEGAEGSTPAATAGDI